MIHGLSNHTTKAVGAIDYFLDEGYFDKESQEWKVREPAAVLLEGDPTQIRALCDSLKFKHRYTTGVLSFTQEETNKINATPGMKEALIEELRSFAYAGFKNDDSKPLFIVEHGHTGRLELHYLIPRVSLESGLSFNPFPPNYDGKTGPGNNKTFLRQNDAFVDHVCERYGLQNPRDPALTRQLKEPVFEKNKPNHDIRRQIVEAIDKQINSGAINSRDDMFKFLESHDAKITRKGDDYFSFKFPEMSKAIRLEGELYGKQSFGEISKRHEERREAFETSRGGAESRYDAVITERASETEARHGKRTAQAEAANSADPEAERNLRETIQVLTEKPDSFSGRARTDAAQFVRSNHEVMMRPDIPASEIDFEVGSCGDPVIDQARRKYAAWLQEIAASYRAEMARSNRQSGSMVGAMVNFARYFVSVFTGKNFVEPQKKTLSVDDLRIYRMAFADELKAAKADLRDIERAQKVADQVRDVIDPFKAHERLKQGSGLSVKDETMKKIADEWREEAKTRKKDKKSDDFSPS